MYKRVESKIIFFSIKHENIVTLRKLMNCKDVLNIYN